MLTCGLGLQVAEHRVCVARCDDAHELRYAEEPAAFIELDDEALAGTPWTGSAKRYRDRWLLVGKDALAAHARLAPEAEPRWCGRSPVHRDVAEAALEGLLNAVVGKATVVGQPCAFGAPAPAKDAAPLYTLHRAVLSDSLRKLGYSPCPVEEGWAVALACLAEHSFSGLVIYSGADQVSVCLTYQGVVRIDFSVAPGESWVDEQASAALEMTVAEVRRIRELAPSLLVPRGRPEQAIAVYFRAFLEKLLVQLTHHLDLQGAPVALEPLQIVWAGSGKTPADLGEAFLREAKKNQFPLPIADVICPKDHGIVARGCLAATMMPPYGESQ